MTVEVLYVCKELHNRAIGTGCNFLSCWWENSQPDEWYRDGDRDEDHVVTRYSRGALVSIRNCRLRAVWERFRGRSRYRDGTTSVSYECSYHAIIDVSCDIPNFSIAYAWFGGSDERLFKVSFGECDYIVRAHTAHAHHDAHQDADHSGITITFTNPHGIERNEFEIAFAKWFDSPIIEFGDGDRWSINDAIAELHNPSSAIIQRF